MAETARLSVDDTLVALPWPYRRRLVLVLQGLEAFSPDPAIRDAAEFFQLKAARVWAAMPFQGHLEEEGADNTIVVEREPDQSTNLRAKRR